MMTKHLVRFVGDKVEIATGPWFGGSVSVGPVMVSSRREMHVLDWTGQVGERFRDGALFSGHTEDGQQVWIEKVGE